MNSTIILITGANSGVGYATTKVLVSASKDFHIIMTSRSLTKVKTAMAELEASKPAGSLSALELDVTDQQSVDTAVAHVTSQYGHLDVLINNAAIGSRGPDVMKRFQDCLTTNVIGPAVVAAAFRPLLLKSSNPYSLFVSSGAASMGKASDPTDAVYKVNIPNGGAYRVSKAALNMLVLQEWIKYAETGLKVFAVCPGFVRSNLRGKSEEEVSGWGQAGDPVVAGEMILGIVKGERNADVGKFVWKDGVYAW
ncbi:short chain dehydrogenase/reductase [Mollisia scopiformis]|uniref:Short chain dehydrogenase/reductase n=1 Tax=Mollisia scopiformis TaxID=149040 RepID=A0A132BAE6_MOLSC|nr:short chain dehydrogenase/reductase [Mollisia scopiformis]KUJ09376.1 short chain dehydrogenase/reductase [Mollisia scopiformis]